MRITHLGHSCLLVEAAGSRVLVDPGSYSGDFTTLTGLDAVLVTHQHPDHVDPDRLPALLAGNAGALLVADPESAALLADHTEHRPILALTGGGQTTAGALSIEGVGDRHAFIHDAVPGCSNTGYLLYAEGEPTLFHPGDAYDGIPARQVDVLALPVNAPWCAVRDTLAFANRIAAPWLLPIHDALLSDIGRAGYLMHVERFTAAPSTVQDLTGRPPWDVP